MNVYTSKFLSIAACSLIGCAVVCSAQGETNFAPLVTGIRTDFEYQPKGAPAPVPELRLQSDLVVTAEGNLDDWADKVAKLKTNVTKEQIIAKLVPYIDGMALMGTYHVSAPREPGSDKRTFIYRIARTAENKDTWTSLLERPGFAGAHREISFTLGTEAGEILPSLFNQEAGGQRLQLMIVSSWWWLTAILLFLFVMGIYLAARYTDIIRDTDCQPSTGKRPYSLARFQMAVWLVLVVTAYLMIWMITRDRGDIPGTVLGLIGISSGTAIGASLIDANKRAARTKAQEAVTELTARLAAVNTLRRLRQSRPTSPNSMPNFKGSMVSLPLHRREQIPQSPDRHPRKDFGLTCSMTGVASVFTAFRSSFGHSCSLVFLSSPSGGLWRCQSLVRAFSP